MFTSWTMAAIIQCSLDNATSRAVLCAIASFVDECGDPRGIIGDVPENAPTQKDLAGRAGCTEQTFVTHVKRLALAGDLNTITHGSGRGSRVEYRILPGNDLAVRSFPSQNDLTARSFLVDERSNDEIDSPQPVDERSNDKIDNPQVEGLGAVETILSVDRFEPETILSVDRSSAPTLCARARLVVVDQDLDHIDSDQQQQPTPRTRVRMPRQPSSSNNRRASRAAATDPGLAWAKSAEYAALAAPRATLAAMGMEEAAIASTLSVAVTHFGAAALPDIVRDWRAYIDRHADTIHNPAGFIRTRLAGGWPAPKQPVRADLQNLEEVIQR